MAARVGIQLPETFGMLFEPARYKGLHGGRGGAKSHSVAGALTQLGVERPLRILCCREIQKSITASVKQLLDDKIREGGLQDDYESTQYQILGRNGTQFLFAGLRSNPDSVKSMEGIDIAWVEEANTVSQRSLDLLLPTVRKEGSEIWATWNRRYTKDPVDNMFLGGEPPPRSIVRKFTWRDNPWFPQVLREEMAWDKRRDHDKYLHVWEGEPIQHSEAKVFKNWSIEDLDGEVPEGCPPRLGADWGFSIDPNVLVKCYIWGRTLYFAEEAYKVGCEIDEAPSLFAGTDTNDPPRWENKHGHKGISGATRHTIVADSARPDTISYMKKHGFPNIRRAIKGARSVEEGVEFMKSYDIVVHPRCIHVIDELGLYSYKVDQQTDEVLAELADRDNHTIDACRYAVESVRRAKHHGSGAAPELIVMQA